MLPLTFIIAIGVVSVPGQETARIDVKVGPAAKVITEELRQRSKNGLGCAVIVEKSGTVVLKAGFGWAKRAEQIPFSTSTIAQIGSLTKQFTATAIVDSFSSK
jgi:CubicO group peptidase (beta-lactamase class C family)